MYLDEITVKDIDDICVINLTRYDMGKKAFLSLRQILKSVFDLAYQNRWIEDNPYTRLNSGKYMDMFVKTTPIEMRVHKPDEIEMMLETLRQHQQKYPSYVGAYALEFQIATAMRRGELPPLKWTDIKDDGKSGYILINKEQITVKPKQKGGSESFVVVHHTKTYKDRKFPITEDVRTCLVKLRNLHEMYYPESLENKAFRILKTQSDRRDSNPRSPPWQGGALPAKLLSHTSDFCPCE